MGRESGVVDVARNCERISNWRHWPKQDTICCGEIEENEDEEKPFTLTNRKLLETFEVSFLREGWRPDYTKVEESVWQKKKEVISLGYF